MKNLTQLSDAERRYYEEFNIHFNTKEDIERFNRTVDFRKRTTEFFQRRLLEQIKIYKLVIRDTGLLFKEIGIDNSLDASNLTSYMILNGFFSKNGYTCKRSANNVLNSFNNYGMSIMKGEGVCLNNVFLLDDVLNELNYPSLSITTSLNQEEQEKKERVVRWLLKGLDSINISNLGNHVCEVIEYQGNYYIYDPTNLLVFLANGTMTVEALNADAKMEIRPLLSVMSGKMKLCELYKLRDVYKSNISYNEASKVVAEAFERLKVITDENYGLIEDFYSAEYERISMIADKMNARANIIEILYRLRKIFMLEENSPKELTK